MGCHDVESILGSRIRVTPALQLLSITDGRSPANSGRYKWQCESTYFMETKVCTSFYSSREVLFFYRSAVGFAEAKAVSNN